MKRDGPKASTTVHGLLGVTYHAIEKAKVIVDCSENQFTSHDLCDENHERQIQVLPASVDDIPLGKVGPCDIHKLVNSVKLRRACGLDGILDDCLRHLPRRPLIHLTHLFKHCLRLSYFSKPWKEAKFITLPKRGKGPKFPPTLSPISLLSTIGKLFEKVILKIVQRQLQKEACVMQASFISVPVTTRYLNV
jgi:hypothetical protein